MGRGFESHQGCAIFHFIKFQLFQEPLFTVENGCCCPRIIGISYVNVYKQKTKQQNNTSYMISSWTILQRHPTDKGITRYLLVVYKYVKRQQRPTSLYIYMVVIVIIIPWRMHQCRWQIWHDIAPYSRPGKARVYDIPLAIWWWPLLCRRHFKMHFLEWRFLSFTFHCITALCLLSFQLTSHLWYRYWLGILPLYMTS